MVGGGGVYTDKRLRGGGVRDQEAGRQTNRDRGRKTEIQRETGDGERDRQTNKQTELQSMRL